MNRDNQHRSEILGFIADVWRLAPELRLCQLLGNLFPAKNDLYFMEDDDLLKRLIDYRKHLASNEDNK